jgi:hypothetical protein
MQDFRNLPVWAFIVEAVMEDALASLIEIKRMLSTSLFVDSQSGRQSKRRDAQSERPSQPRHSKLTADS